MTNEEIFNDNINIAYKIANKYLINYRNEYEDIKQVALLGLWKAVLTFKLGCNKLENIDFKGTNECRYADNPITKIKKILGIQEKIDEI